MMVDRPRVLVVGDAHQRDHGEPDPERGELRHQPGEDVERGAPFARRDHHFLDGTDSVEVNTFTSSDDGARERATCDDERQLPPERSVSQSGDQQMTPGRTRWFGYFRRYAMSGFSKFIFVASP